MPEPIIKLICRCCGTESGDAETLCDHCCDGSAPDDCPTVDCDNYSHYCETCDKWMTEYENKNPIETMLIDKMIDAWNRTMPEPFH